VTNGLSRLRQQLFRITTTPVKRQEVMTVLGATGTARPLVERHARDLIASRRACEARLRTVIEEARTQALEERLRAMKRLGARVETLVAEARARLAPRICEVTAGAGSVKQEAGKLGLALGRT
jgi:predicted transcriptional regulator